jgi:hypothetical protein
MITAKELTGAGDQRLKWQKINKNETPSGNDYSGWKNQL